MIVDTNIILDILGPTNSLANRSRAAFGYLASKQQPIVNQVIFAEIAPRHSSREAVEARLALLGIDYVSFSPEEAFRAGVAFARYRQRGGRRERILPDFLIGAQAAVRSIPILTRDRQGFESYFPEVELIDPTMVSHD